MALIGPTLLLTFPAFPQQATTSAHAQETVKKSTEAAAAKTPKAATAGPNLTIDAGSGQHTISPYIYGINYNQNLLPYILPTVVRWGGDATSQYNPTGLFANSGSDYYFANGVQTPSFEQFFETNKAAGALTIGTIPVNGYVAKDGTSCGFSVKKYGPQRCTDPGNSDCGDGIVAVAQAGASAQTYSCVGGGTASIPAGQAWVPITQVKTTDPTDADVASTPSTMQSWVSSVVSKYGDAASGGVAIWQMDNEPVWWESVHQNIHPTAQDYDETWQKGMSYAQAVKAADPTASVAGPITSVWYDLFFSRKDLNSGWATGPDYVYWGNPIDRQAHGNEDFVAWYLQQFANYEQQNGQRLLDYFDVHGYMPGTGSDATDPASVAARMASTRVFWDPNYVVANSSGVLFASGGPTGSATTGNWVSNGTTFALVDSTSGLVLATTTVALSNGSPAIVPSSISFSSGASITSSPSTIQVGSGVSTGQTTLTWSAPSSTGVQIYIGSGNYLDNQCICLIPRMKNWVNANYPGTKLTISEYILGAETTSEPSGAIAEADLLGIFGREGLDVATMWPERYPNLLPTDPVTYAFRLYRNYDGAGGQFGANGVSAVSGDQTQLSSYAALRSDGALTVMIVNKTPNNLSSNVSLANFVPASTAKVYQYSGANLTAIQTLADQAVTASGFSATFPAYSATLVVMQAPGPATISASPNPIQVPLGITVGQTTLTWDAPSSTTVDVYVGGVGGTLFTSGGPTGSAQTGDWVSNGDVFTLVDGTTHQAIATTTVSVVQTAPTATFTASPNPIPVPPGATTGQTTLTWNAPDSTTVDIYVGGTNGSLFASGGPTGSAQTGGWVSNGMVFTLVDGTSHQVLATATVSLVTVTPTASFTASPNPISVPPGITTGQTTLSWNAPASTTVNVYVGSQSGPLFTSGGPKGSATTGDWVSNGMVFVLVDGTTQELLATATVSLVTVTPTASFSASPNPILVAPGATLGQTTLTWNAPGSTAVEIHLGSATGTLFASLGPTGSAQTGGWVSNGMVFVLVDGTTHQALATTAVSVIQATQVTLLADPNPIPLAAGAASGQTTLVWNAPGSSLVEIHVGSATGPLFTTQGPSGTAVTGDWVSNGMQFVLLDANTRVTLATTTVYTTSAGT